MTHPRSLSSARDFRRVLSEGRALRPRWATVHAVRKTALGPSRLGLAVPATVGGAVERNRIKRRLRAAFRLAAPSTGLDVVVRARAEAATVPFQELEETFSGLRA